MSKQLGKIWVTRIKGPECSTVIGYTYDPTQARWWKNVSDVWGPWDFDAIEQNSRLFELVQAGYVFDAIDEDEVHWSLSDDWNFCSSLEEAIKEAWEHYVQKSDTNN